MANEIKLKTRLLNLYEDSKTSNPRFNSDSADEKIKLKKGEILFHEEMVATDSGKVPVVLMKVGDGVTTNNKLNVVAARAADVYEWAKQATKPDYVASEIDYTKTTKEYNEDGEVISTKTEEITTQKAIDALYEAIATLSGDSGASIADLISRIGTIEADYLKAASLAPYATTEALNGKIAEVNGNLNKKVDQVAGKSLVSDTEIARLADVDNYDDTQVKADIAKNTTAASNAQAAAEAAQNDVNAIKADYLKASDKTELSNAIAAEKTRAEGIEAGLRTDVNVIKGDYLKATDKTTLEGKITTAQNTATAAKGAIDAFLLDADVKETAINTLKEIQAELDNNETGAAAMAARIKVLEDENHATSAELETAVNGLDTKIAGKADASTVTAIDGRVETLEKAGYATTTQVASAKSEAISTAAKDAQSKADATLASAKTYADQAEADAVATAAADAKTKADNAETKAKTHATGLNTAMDTRVKALENIDHNAYKSADTALHTAISAEIDADV